MTIIISKKSLIGIFLFEKFFVYLIYQKKKNNENIF